VTPAGAAATTSASTPALASPMEQPDRAEHDEVIVSTDLRRL
jgi:hypothetical protein